MIDGLEVIESALDQAGTIARVKAELAARGMQVFAHIDHAAGAVQAGLTLGPTDLLLFGNPVAGTHLMQEQPSAGIDLPLKILIWTTDDGRTHLGYNRPGWIAARHHIEGTGAVVERMIEMLRGIAAKIAT